MMHTFPGIPDFSGIRFLVTGGAGFIGSHVIDFLLKTGAPVVTVLDNFSTGSRENLSPYFGSDRFSLLCGDITNFADCESVVRNIDIVVHLAALGSVPRSVTNPLATHEANATGFLNILTASKAAEVKKVIYASSSSVYGDNNLSPKKEGNEGRPLSPYAATKQNNELYARLYTELYGLGTIGLRFFNIFGPRQTVNGPYAAFVPLLMNACYEGKVLNIFGDGHQSRDFTYVANAVWAVNCAIQSSTSANGKAFNVGCGESSDLLTIVGYMEEISGRKIQIEHKAERQGDVRNSLADLSMSKSILGYQSLYGIREGLAFAYKFFTEKQAD